MSEPEKPDEPKPEEPKPEEPKPEIPATEPKPEIPATEPKPEIPAPEGPKPEEPEPEPANPDVPKTGAKTAKASDAKAAPVDDPKAGKTKAAASPSPSPSASAASAAASLPPASLRQRVTNSFRELNLVWLAIGIPVFFTSSVLSAVAAKLLMNTTQAAVIVVSVVVFAGGGVFLGRFAKGRAILQAGISAAIMFLIAAAITGEPDEALAAKIDPLAWMLGGTTGVFDLAVLGALLGDAMKPRVEGMPDAWDRAASWLADYGAIPALVQLTILIAIVHAHVFAGETVGDDLSFHFAESARLADCLRVGDFDMWNPSANAGYASAYYYQVIPQLASAIPAAIFGHHLFWFQLSVWLPHVAAPVAAYKGMRLLGATPWQSVIGAFCVAFMNGESRWGAGNAGTFQVGLYTQTWALAAFPLALGYSARWISERKGLAPAIAWSAFVGLCHPFAAIVLGVGLAFAVIASIFPRLTGLTWQGILGRALIMFGIAELFLFPPEWARLAFIMNRLGLDALPEAFAYVVGYGCIISGLAICVTFGLVLPMLDRPAGERWKLPELQAFGPEFWRTVVLGLGLVIAMMPVAVPLLSAYSGFGGFPHRVWDEVGPGFMGLATWYKKGAILDYAHPDQVNRIAILTWSLPIVLLLCRSRMMRWFWPASLLFALLLGIGPHLSKIGDDLFPPVRALGAMQTLLALGIGAGAIMIGKLAWHATVDSIEGKITRAAIATLCGVLVIVATVSLWSNTFVYIGIANLLAKLHLYFDDPLLIHIGGTLVLAALVALTLFGVIPLWKALGTQYGVRTALSAIAAALLVLVAVPGGRALAARVVVLSDYPNSHRDEMMKINEFLATQPPGRKITAPGAENHWWNMLSYAYDRVPSTLQMGGGGLQASPNYDFLWWLKTQYNDYKKIAWLYDAPYVVFQKSSASKAPGGETLLRTENYEVRRLDSPGLVSPVRVVGYLDPTNVKVDTLAKMWAQMYVNSMGHLPPGYHSEQLGHIAAVQWIRGEQPLRDEVIAYDGSGGPGDPPDGKMLRAWHQDSPGDEPDIVAEVEANKPTTFMIRESWHPQWRAYLDGEPIAVRRVTPDFPAVDVPPGKHTISLRFERPWWALASWLAWPGAAVLAWLLTRRRKVEA